MLSARPVLRNAVRSAAVAARSSARVVCITHFKLLNGFGIKGGKEFSQFVEINR